MHMISLIAALIMSSEAFSGYDGDLDTISASMESDVIILGEIHGSSQAPEFFFDLINASVRTSEKPVAALELPPVDRDALCDPTSMDGQALTTASWKRSYQDGRTSAAMHDLLCRLFDMERDNLLNVMFLERGGDEENNGSRFNIENVVNEVITNKRKIYILMGNYHARIGDHVSSFAKTISDQGVDVLSLTVTALSANTWACTSELPSSCGVREFGANFCDLAPGDERPVILKDGASRRTAGFPWDGCFNIVEATPSPPMFPQ